MSTGTQLSAHLDPRGTTRAIAFAMRSLEQRYEVATSNLSNLETAGHKRLVARSQSFASEFGRVINESSVVRDFTQGAVVPDDDLTQLALQGEGFFAVEQGDQVRYTRWLRVAVESDGTLIDQNGGRLLGEGGPLRVGPGSKVQVERDGTLKGSDQEASAGRLRVVAFLDPQELQALPGGYFRAPDGLEVVAARDTDVVQGARERPNTNAVHELVDLITIHRQFDAVTKALQVENDLRTKMNQGLR